MARKANRSGSAVRDLGCTYAELRVHLEDQFEAGMTWDNYGRGKGRWHIDHKIPFALLDLSDSEQFARAVHYENLRPRWSEDNVWKGTKLEPPMLF
jgi:hypothetical protein